jgi:trans-aconitate methyltransferase
MEPVDDSFKCDWIINQGIDQSRCFMIIIAEELLKIERFIPTDVKTILDWGCAMGSGTDILYDYFYLQGEIVVRGLDISWHAINAAQQIYPHITFRCDDYINGMHDLIVTSNCLEHFEDPKPYMEHQMEHASNYYVALVPHNDLDTPGHLYAFTERDFPESLNGFERVYISIIPRCSHWDGEQIFVLYQRKE